MFEHADQERKKNELWYRRAFDLVCNCFFTVGPGGHSA